MGYGPWGHKRVRYALASKQQQYTLHLKKPTLKFDLCCVVAAIGVETRNQGPQRKWSWITYQKAESEIEPVFF